MSDYRLHAEPTAGGEHTLFDSSMEMIGEVRCSSYERQEQFANLFTAAPQLLEVAIEAEKLLLPLAKQEHDHDRYQVMVLVLRQAIAKATEKKVVY